MISRSPSVRRDRGVTLVELMIAMTIMAVVAVLATQTFVAFGRTDNLRRKVTDVQSTARATLAALERDMRLASLGATTGRIWTSSGANRVVRPSVQVFWNIQGGGSIDLDARPYGQPKAFTDALLIVGGTAAPRAATTGEITLATAGMPRTLSVTTLTSRWGGVDHTFAEGDRILVGDYLDASWATIASTNAGPQITAVDDVRLPGDQIPRLAAGSVVRRARARLYYVDVADRLVRLDLNVPRAPADLAEIDQGEVLAEGVENLQVRCEVGQAQGTLAPCPSGVPDGDLIRTESATFFGTFEPGDGNGPLLADASTLRTVTVSVAVRSRRPLHEATGDPPITVESMTLTPGEGADPDAAYARRGYQLTAGIRNTSLEAF